MIFDSITLANGATVLNLNVQSGDNFPNDPTFAELFFKTGSNPGLYIFQTEWIRILSQTDFGEGTFTKVVLDSFGQIIAASSPTTLAGYGIIDAVNIDSLGKPGGVATLDTNGKIQAGQISTSIIEAPNFNSFPTSGVFNTIYVARDSNKIFRWNFNEYVELSPNTIHNTDYLAEGSQNLYFTKARVIEAIADALLDAGQF